MAAQAGRKMVLYIGDGATSEQFDKVGGQRVTRLTINNTSVDITDKDSDAWTELLANVAGRNVAMSIEGIYKGGDGWDRLVEIASGDTTVANFRMIFEDDDTMWSGAWQVTSFEESGAHDNARMFTANFASSGAITFGSST